MIYLITGIFVVLLGLCLTQFSYIVAKAKDLHDHPDDHRKLHDSPTPATGGVGIGIAFLFGVFIIMMINGIEAPDQFKHFLWYFMAGALVMFATGAYDDLFGLSSIPKFAMQAVAGSITLIGLHNEYLVTYDAYQQAGPLFSIFLFGVMMFWILACSNMINLIDGVDGLAGTISLTIMGGLQMIALTWAVPEIAVILVPLAAAVLAFLNFNKPPASIFMGDTGSLLIGYTLSVTGIVLAFYAPHYQYSFSIILLMAVPGIDTLFAIIRRTKMGINPFESDHYHIHHILQTYYRSPALTVITLASVSVIFGITAILLANSQNEVIYFSVFGFMLLLLAGISIVYASKLDVFISVVREQRLHYLLKLRSTRESLKTEQKRLAQHEQTEEEQERKSETYANTFKN